MNGSGEVSVAHCWEGFRPERYVQRHNLRTAIEQWLNDPQQNRRPLLSLVGPPGVGKSWLLASLHHEMTAAQCVLLWDARDLLDASKHDQMKRDLVRAANACCSDVHYPADLLPPLPALIENLSQQLCNRCPTARFLILVDGCDDLGSREEFDTLQREYLLRFFVAGCSRMIVARRLGLTEHSLRRLNTTLRVGVFESEEEAQCQRDRLLAGADRQGTGWPQLPDGCNYRWQHPYINCYLLAVHGAGRQITTEILADCCRSLIQRVHLEEPNRRQPGQGEVRNSLGELRSIAQGLPDQWTKEDLKATIGKDLDFSVYLHHSLVSVNESGDVAGPQYAIVDGLRELLRALPEKELRS